MTPEEGKRMTALCTAIQGETDHDRFAAILHEMSELIARKEQRRFQQYPKLVWRRNRPWRTMSASVRKIGNKTAFANAPEEIEISITDAEHLFREVRIENSFSGVDGRQVALVDGAHLDVTFEAETKKPD